MNELVLKMQFKYLCKLIDRIYKIIPLKEEGVQSVDIYINNLISEILGNSDLINSIDCDPRVMIIVSTLNSVISVEEHELYKKSVFKCIKYIEQLRDIVLKELSKCENHG